MSTQPGVMFSSDWHDPVSKIQLKTDPNTGSLYHKGSYYEESRDYFISKAKHKRVAPYLARLSKDPVLRSSQADWLKRGVNPFSGRDLMRYAANGRNQYGRWLAMSNLDAYGLLESTLIPSLTRVVRTDSYGENRAIALSLIAKLKGSAAEDLYLNSLADPAFRYKFCPISLIDEYGTARSIPAICTYLKRAIRRRRQAQGRETEVALCVRFLNRFLDTHDDVATVFDDVVRYWHNLDFAEAKWISVLCRYIGIRVLDPVEPATSDDPERVTIHGAWGKRRLWKDKSRFRHDEYFAKKEDVIVTPSEKREE